MLYYYYYLSLFSSHHEFPSDYRNAILWYQFDPTKWLIKATSYLGLTWDLKTFPNNEIQKGRLMMQEKALDAVRRGLDWGVPMENLKSLEYKQGLWYNIQCQILF